MRVAPIGYLPYLYRSNTVRVLYCRWHGFALFCAYRERGNKCHWHITNPKINMNNSVTSDFAVLFQKVTTLIPIALLPSMTAWLRAAVSSLEACQTPAR